MWTGLAIIAALVLLTWAISWSCCREFRKSQEEDDQNRWI